MIAEHVKTLAGRGIIDIRFSTPNAFAYGSGDGRSSNAEALGRLMERTAGILPPAGRIFLGSFPSEVRPEHVTPETLGLVKRYAENDYIVLGAQTGSPGLMKKMRRGHTVEDVRCAVELCAGEGIGTIVDFIFGLPEETPEDLALTLGLMRDLAKSGSIIHAHSFMPLPGTALAASRPGSIKHELRKLMRELASQGLLFGNWRKQADIAGKMPARSRLGLQGFR